MDSPSAVPVLRLQGEIEKVDRAINQKEELARQEASRAEIATALGNILRFLDETRPYRWRKYFLADWSGSRGKPQVLRAEDTIQVDLYGSAPLRNLLNKSSRGHVRRGGRVRHAPISDLVSRKETTLQRLAEARAAKWLRSEGKIAGLERELAGIGTAIGKASELAVLNFSLEDSRACLRQLLRLGDKLGVLKEKRRRLQAELDHEAAFLSKHELAYAKASAYEDETREQAARVAHSITATDRCPYCEGLLGDNPHLDHIYPVSRGGLSISENLVYCCASCNLQKGDAGLLEFLSRKGWDPSAVSLRLRRLGKRV